MRLNNRQWNVTKNDLFFRNKSETNTHTHTAVFIYLFIIHLLVVLFIIVVVAAFAFCSLLFAIGVFGSIQRTFSFLQSSSSSAGITCRLAPFATLCTFINLYPEAIFNIHCMLKFSLLSEQTPFACRFHFVSADIRLF